MRRELDEPGILPEDRRSSRPAFGSLPGLLNTESRERSSVFSAAANAIHAYASEGALGELVGAAREGVLALSVGVGLRVAHELMEAEVTESAAELVTV
jgi:hypothetical protein